MIDYDKIVDLHKNGLSYREIANDLNVSKSLVSFYCNEKNRKKRIDDAKKKAQLKDEYEKLVCDLLRKSNSFNEVCVLLNKRPTNTNYQFLKKIVDKYSVDISHFGTRKNIKRNNILTYDDIFCENSKVSCTSRVKNKIFELSLKEYKCECCGLTEWNGDKIPLELHHINGDRTDNRMENLQILCRNCHAQTDNFCGKNIKNKKVKKTLCKECGKEIKNNGQVFCSEECKKSYKEKEKKYPSKEELLIKYKELGSFKKIGEFYGSSDKTVSKWFEKHGLPCTAKEIRKFIIDLYGKQPQWYSYFNNRDYTKSIDKLGIKVDVFDENNNFINTFDSLKKASDYTKVDFRTIRKRCKGLSKQSGKYIFKHHNIGD